MGTRTFVSGRVRSPRTGIPDLPLLVVVVALAIIGLLMLYSASPDYSLNVLGRAPFYLFDKQIIWMALGAVIAFILSRLDYHQMNRLSVPMMAVTILLLIAVLLNNDERNGVVRAFINGSVQPSELAKLVTIIYLSVWLYSKRENLGDVQLGLIPLAIILGIVGGLIYIQPDLSAAATIIILGGLLFFLSGGDLRQIIFFLVLALLVGYLVISLSPTGRDRLASFIAGLKDPLNSNDHVRFSLEAIVKGGWFGVGIGRSETKLTGLPVPPTDSIFAVLVEELGLVGALGLVGLYSLLLWRGLRIARNAPDALGSVMAGGLTFWLAIEALINMGVMVGLLPFAGNALPFISAGGSSLLSSLAAIGLLMSISRQAGAPGPVDEWRSYSASVDLRRGDRRRRVPRSRRL